MVQLRSCYFCGTTEAVSEYETLPDDLRAGGDGAQRVALCDRCRTKLTNVLAPLVERLGSGGVDPAPSAHDAGDASEAPGRVGSSTIDPPNQAAVTFTSESTNADGTPDAADGDSDDTEHGRGDVARGDDAESETADAASHTADAAGVTDTSDAGSKPDADDARRDADVTDDADATAGEEPSASTGGETAARNDLDRVYHKLLRFLRNREFPVPRAEAEAVAQSAYDLSVSEATQVIQRAVDHGVLEERDGELHRR